MVRTNITTIENKDLITYTTTLSNYSYYKLSDVMDLLKLHGSKIREVIKFIERIEDSAEEMLLGFDENIPNNATATWFIGHRSLELLILKYLR